MADDEMVGWHHGLNGNEFEQAPGDGEGQGSLACCSPWGCRELNTTWRLNNNNRVKTHCLLGATVSKKPASSVSLLF